MSRLAIFTARRPVPFPADPDSTPSRLVLGNPPPGAPSCDRCPERAALELERGSGRTAAYCIECLLELVGFGEHLDRPL